MKKMRRFVDHVLCKLPFEEAWYRERGCNATFVGHPYFDQLRAEAARCGIHRATASRRGPLVAILPGSRTQEVKSNLGYFLKAAKIVRNRVPNARFAVASFKESQARDGPRAASPAAHCRSKCMSGRTAEIIEAADCAMAVSGSVSLGAAVSHEADGDSVLHFAAGVLRADVLPQGPLHHAGESAHGGGPISEACGDVRPETTRQDAHVLMPEYLTCGDKSAEVAAHVVEWLTDSAKRVTRIAQLAELKDRVGHGGASRRAADYMLNLLESRQKPVLRTHLPLSATGPDAVRDAA